MESKEIKVYGTLINQTEGSVKDTTHNDAIVKSYQVYDNRFGAGGTADYQDNINKRVKGINYQSGNPGVTTIEGKLVVTNGMDVTGNSTVDNLQVDGNENVSGNLNVNGSTTLKNTTINGTETVNGSSNVTGNQSVGGNLDVNGTTNLKNTNINGNETVTGNATVNGTTTLKNTVINGTETVNGNQSVTGDQTVGGNTTVQGDVIVRGDQVVDGGITIKGETIIEGTTQIVGELTGDATLRNLTVTGSVSGISLSDLDDITGTNNAVAGQVLKYNGSKWAPGTDETGSGGGSGTADLSTATGTLDPSKIGQGGATNGQILVYNSSTGKWVPTNQPSGSGSSGSSQDPSYEPPASTGGNLDDFEYYSATKSGDVTTIKAIWSPKWEAAQLRSELNTYINDNTQGQGIGYTYGLQYHDSYFRFVLPFPKEKLNGIKSITVYSLSRVMLSGSTLTQPEDNSIPLYTSAGINWIKTNVYPLSDALQPVEAKAFVDPQLMQTEPYRNEFAMYGTGPNVVTCEAVVTAQGGYALNQFHFKGMNPSGATTGIIFSMSGLEYGRMFKTDVNGHVTNYYDPVSFYEGLKIGIEIIVTDAFSLNDLV